MSVMKLAMSLEHTHSSRFWGLPKWASSASSLVMCQIQTFSRARLAIQGGQVHKSGFEAIKQRVVHVPAMSLAEILATYSL